MTESDWLNATEPEGMLAFQRDSGTLSERKARLCAVACCRRIWHLLTDERSRRVVEVAERYAEGTASQADCKAAARGAWDAAQESAPNTNDDMRSLACLHALVVDPGRAAGDTSFYASRAAVGRGELDEPSGHELAGQAALLRDLLGPLPFRAVLIDPAWLTWKSGVVVRIAQAAYDNRQLPCGTLVPARLAVLADALEEAGCADAEVLGHLRSPGPHARGCWALDLILGKV
jgi:hypothetical protein